MERSMIERIVTELMEEYGAKWLMYRYKVSRQSVWKWKTAKNKPKAHIVIDMIHDYNDFLNSRKRRSQWKEKSGLRNVDRG